MDRENIPLLYLQGCLSMPTELARAVTLCMLQSTAMYKRGILHGFT